jgi:hypothetical protein
MIYSSLKAEYPIFSDIPSFETIAFANLAAFSRSFYAPVVTFYI